MNKRTLVLLWLIGSQLLMALSLLLWLAAAGLSIMAFDSGVTASAALFVGAIWAYPLVLIVFAVLAWRAYGKQKHLQAAILTTVPLIAPLLYGILLML